MLAAAAEAAEFAQAVGLAAVHRNPLRRAAASSDSPNCAGAAELGFVFESEPRRKNDKNSVQFR